MRIVHHLIPLAAFALVPQVLAQPAQSVAIAHLQHVTGNVLVSKETGLASGNESAPLTKGSRVITTANSEVTVVYDNGCEVKLKPNQRFEVADKPCRELQARAESILAEPAAAVAAAGSTGVVAAASGLVAGSSALPLAALGGLAGLAALQSTRESQAVSPH